MPAVPVGTLIGIPWAAAPFSVTRKTLGGDIVA